jgi:hypothetical protein
VGDPKEKEHGVRTKHLNRLKAEPGGSAQVPLQTARPSSPEIGSRWTLSNMPELNGKFCEVQAWHGHHGKVTIVGDPKGKEHSVSRKHIFPIRTVEAQLSWEQLGSLSVVRQSARSGFATAECSPRPRRDLANCPPVDEEPPRSVPCPRRRRSTGDRDFLQELEALRQTETLAAPPPVPHPSLAPSRDEPSCSGAAHGVSTANNDERDGEMPPEYTDQKHGNRQKRVTSQHRKKAAAKHLARRAFEFVPW